MDKFRRDVIKIIASLPLAAATYRFPGKRAEAHEVTDHAYVYRSWAILQATYDDLEAAGVDLHEIFMGTTPRRQPHAPGWDYKWRDWRVWHSGAIIRPRLVDVDVDIRARTGKFAFLMHGIGTHAVLHAVKVGRLKVRFGGGGPTVLAPGTPMLTHHLDEDPSVVMRA